MVDLFTFLSQPESAAFFIEELKAGKISMNWQEILEDEEKRSNLHELTYGLMMQAADNTALINTQKLIPLLGRIFILNRQLETATEDGQDVTQICKEFEAAIREFAGLIDVDKAVESIRSLQENSDEDILNADLYTECPLFTLIFALRLLVYAHEAPELDQDADDEELFHACDEDDECEQ